MTRAMAIQARLATSRWRQPGWRRVLAFWLVMGCCGAPSAWADTPAPTVALGNGAAAVVPGDVEVPQLVYDVGAQALEADDTELDLANVVQSAAKGVTTVQEAPAIVTVVTADEIRERQFTTLAAIVDTVPGWYRTGLLHSTFEIPLVRGQVQAMQFLHDSLSLFDPFLNVPTTHRGQPIELIKRVEMITGPGGVLWGANSLLGILNVITKDADDVDGVEVGGRVGGGIGDRSNGHAYVMYGDPAAFGGRGKVFAHAAIDSYRGPGLTMPLLVFHQPLPQPNSPNSYGPLVTTDQLRSLLVSLNGKVSLGKWTLRASYPLGQRHNPMGLSGTPVRSTLPEDAACQGATAGPECLDPLKASRTSNAAFFDRYVAAEYRTRWAASHHGIAVKAYGIEFKRSFDALQVLAPSALVPGGLSFVVDNTSYRAGLAVDGDVRLGARLRLQYGAEGFAEWKRNDTARARGGYGNEAVFHAPYDVARLPLLCPRQYNTASGQVEFLDGCPMTFAYAANRVVLGAYANPQWRPHKRLIIDAGARLQAAPAALGSLAYPLNATFAAAAVWNIVPNWHAKLNYTEGFRPPVFNNTISNGAAVQIGGNPNLAVETSNAVQAELNARIFKGERRIRELSFRVDASYTRLRNLIQVQSGAYTNAGDRELQSGEFLGKLYVQGGHRLELGYTYLRGITGDKGRLRNLPEHWFNLGGVWNLIPGRVQATLTLRVAGAMEDANRLVEYRDAALGPNGGVAHAVDVTPAELVIDRLPPSAELNGGITWTPRARVTVAATLYNAMRSHAYQPDAFGDYEPHLEYLPNPYEGFRAYLSISYAY